MMQPLAEDLLTTILAALDQPLSRSVGEDGKGGVMLGAQTRFSLAGLFHFSPPAPSPLGQLGVKHFSPPVSAELPSFHGWSSLATASRDALSRPWK